jgi:uncharacterized protein YndB with AHSA1/START domain
MGSVRAQISIAAGTRDVWRVLTTADGLRGWWATSARLDAREGGTVVLRVVNGEGVEVDQRGLCHEVRPVRRVELAFDARGDGPEAGCRVEFLVARDGEETRVALTCSGSPLDDDARRVAAEATWKKRLERLRTDLESTGEN